MLDPGQIVEETVTVQEDPQEVPSISVETDEDGTTRRTETTVKKVVKTVTTRTVIPSVSDTLSLDGGGSVTGGYSTMDRVYRQGGGVGGDYPTVPRNYHYGPPGGYDDYRPGPPSEAYSSLSRGAHMDDRYRSYEGALDRDMGDMYYWGGGAPLAQGERGSMASLDSTLRKGPPPTGWRQPELPEVIAMLNPPDTIKERHHNLPPPRLLQVKSDVRRLKGILSLTPSLTNTTGCLRNVSSERSEARRKLRECTGLVDSLMYIVQSQIDRKEVDNKLIENSMCLLRNLSYQVHREVPGHERYQEATPLNQGPASSSSQKTGCFSARKGKGKKEGDDTTADPIDLPKRTTPAKGYELLFQPEVVRVYTSLLKESKNPVVLEAAAGAVQNLCAGCWTYGRYIRTMVRQEKGLIMMTELLSHSNDRVVRAMSGALRNLAIDARNRDLLGKHTVPSLVGNLPGAGQQQPVRALSEGTVVSVLSTLAEVLGSSVEAAKTLRASQGIERLVLINKDGNRSEREVRGAGQVLQIVWGFKELRRTLEKDGWKKTDFMVNLNPPAAPRSNGAYEDSTLPLIDRGEKSDREPDMIPLNDMGPDAYSTLDPRERRNTLENSLDTSDRDAVQGEVYGDREGSEPLVDSYDG
ncbi:hypothetical protein MATL_G00220700 [Megalops atlanticus]|uniref:Catenin (Cadherin-associated protein), delta 1 n=1 Tax=Megalops atlanticus TaxID=7932 RepID=A0A9D3PHY6_MEGAT|nr:hypothetical protein MATL_G00220700 [Megalops atlanticus]